MSLEFLKGGEEHCLALISCQPPQLQQGQAGLVTFLSRKKFQNIIYRTVSNPILLA